MMRPESLPSVRERSGESPKGAGQYFTPRELIRAIVDVMQPSPDDTVCDPACGTGGFLVSAHDFVLKHHGSDLDKDQKKHLKRKLVHGADIVPNTARLYKRFDGGACTFTPWMPGVRAPHRPLADGRQTGFPDVAGDAKAAQLLAGVAKVDITNRAAGPVNDPLYVKALVLKSNTTTAVLITVDVVAIGEIGLRNDYLPKVRSRLRKELGIRPANVLVNASHCHGIVCADVDERTFQAVRAAMQNMVPVKVGAGVGHENRIMENRRLKLKNGREADVRHAYSMPPDEEVAALGPVDPQIDILRLDRKDGRILAIVYNFACHPIMGVPSGANTADIIGFASKVIEDNLSEGTMALFLQGCCGDINPVFYKDCRPSPQR